MPEELNRIVADHLSDLLLTTCADGDHNLLREGIPEARIVDVGNTMIDSLVRLRTAAEATVAGTRAALGLGDLPLVLATLHRPSNVDDAEQLLRLLGVLREIAAEADVALPVHPRTKARLAAAGHAAGHEHPRLHLVEPLGYLEFLGLLTLAGAVVTDSGGIQEETTFLGIPCVTVRTTTERPVTVTLGTNTLVDPHDPDAILAAVRAALAHGVAKPPPAIPLWDGAAGERAVEALARWAAGELGGGRTLA
jgi:UDP-N-acetylglucosamine 2-epimerase (non-hydrolysing)